MRVNRLITTAVDIQDTVSIYSDIQQNLLNILANRYVGRCLRGVLIESVDKLVQISPCFINQDGDPTHGTINVIMKVKAILFEPGEVIVGCRVIRRIPQAIICQHKHAAIMLTPAPILDSVAIGQIISVRVITSKYDLNASAISVSAIPFVPVAPTSIYKISAGKDGAVAEFLADELADIAAIEAEIEEVKNTDSFKFFAGLLDPNMAGANKSSAAAASPAKQPNVKQIREIVETLAEPLIISRGYGCPTGEPVVAVLTDAELKTAAVAASDLLPAADALLLVLRHYRYYLQSVIDHINTYNTPEILNSHKNIWAIIAMKSKI